MSSSSLQIDAKCPWCKNALKTSLAEHKKHKVKMIRIFCPTCQWLSKPFIKKIEAQLWVTGGGTKPSKVTVMARTDEKLFDDPGENAYNKTAEEDAASMDV